MERTGESSVQAASFDHDLTSHVDSHADSSCCSCDSFSELATATAADPLSEEGQLEAEAARVLEYVAYILSQTAVDGVQAGALSLPDIRGGESPPPSGLARSLGSGVIQRPPRPMPASQQASRLSC